MAFWNKDEKHSAVTEDQILGALKQVQDPDLRKDIVSLGFIRNLKIDSGKVSFDLNLTTPACPVKDQMRDQAIALVKGLPGVENVEIKMTSDGTPWRPLVHALDIGKAIACVLDSPREAVHNQVFNVGDTRQNYRVRDVAEIVAEVFESACWMATSTARQPRSCWVWIFRPSRSAIG